MASSAFKYFCNNCLYYFGIGWNESGSVTFLSLLYFLWHVPNVEKFEPVRIFYDWLLIPDLSDEARSSVFISYFCMLPVILRWNFFHRLFSGFFFFVSQVLFISLLWCKYLHSYGKTSFTAFLCFPSVDWKFLCNLILSFLNYLESYPVCSIL